MQTKDELELQELHIDILERIAKRLETLVHERNAEAGSICWYCTPSISDTTEQKNCNYCPICGRKLKKED